MLSGIPALMPGPSVISLPGAPGLPVPMPVQSWYQPPLPFVRPGMNPLALESGPGWMSGQGFMRGPIFHGETGYLGTRLPANLPSPPPNPFPNPPDAPRLFSGQSALGAEAPISAETAIPMGPVQGVQGATNAFSYLPAPPGALSSLPPPPAGAATLAEGAAPEAIAATESAAPGILGKFGGAFTKGALGKLGGQLGLGAGTGSFGLGGLLMAAAAGRNSAQRFSATPFGHDVINSARGVDTHNPIAQGIAAGPMSTISALAQQFNPGQTNDTVDDVFGAGGALGWIPFLGGGATAPDYSDAATKAKLNSFNFSPEARAAVVGKFNQRQADLEATGNDRLSARTQAYNEFFTPQQAKDAQGNDIKDKTITGAEQFAQHAQGAADQQHQQAQAQAAQAAQSQQQTRQALAMQALIAQVAPEIMGNSHNLDQYNATMPGVIDNLQGPMKAFAQKSQADANLANTTQQSDNAKFMQSLPALYMYSLAQKQAAQEQQANDRVQQLILEKQLGKEVSAQAGGGGTTDLNALLGQQQG